MVAHNERVGQLDSEAALPGPGELVESADQLDGPERTQAVRVSIPELQVASEFHPDAEGRAELDIVADPEPWSPERPRLYRVEIRSGLEQGDRVAVAGVSLLTDGAWAQDPALASEAAAGKPSAPAAEESTTDDGTTEQTEDSAP